MLKCECDRCGAVSDLSSATDLPVGSTTITLQAVTESDAECRNELGNLQEVIPSAIHLCANCSTAVDLGDLIPFIREGLRDEFSTDRSTP